MSANSIGRQRPLRLGFAGVGWIGLHRMKALVEGGGVEVTAICDSSNEAAARARECAASATISSCFEDLLALDLDGVVIATPSAQHAVQTIAALDRGFAVFCQKPLGRTATETQAAVATARRVDRLLHVDFSYRFTEAAKTVHAMIAAGDIGEVFACDLTFHNAYGPDKPWFYDVGQSGGGCVMDLGVHLIDLALWILPDARVERVDASLFRNGERIARPPESVEDFALAHMRLSTGAELRVACSWNLHAGRDAVINARFHGSKAGAAIRNVNGSFYDFTAERFSGTHARTLCEPPDEWGGRAAVHWARRLGASRAFDPEADTFVHVAETLDRIYGR